MRDPFVASSPHPRAGNLNLRLALSGLLLASSRILELPTAAAFTFASVPSPNLNLNNLGRVAFAGDFDSISLYQYQGQSEKSTSGDHGGLLSRFPNGMFATVEEADGDIRTMCAFQANGTLQGIVVGGNFTSVGPSNGNPPKRTDGGIALVNPTDGTVTALTGLNGTVNALYCDADAGRVYVGGSFSGGGATNAIVWTTGWTNMPFSGFNGPVNSITKHNGKIIFGGKFNGLGNSSAPRENNTMVIPIGSANISAQTSSGLPGLTDPRNIVCKTGATDGTGNTWLLADNTPGFWKADFGFGFEPSRLRLYNTKFEGRGTREWRYTALPDGGIMNFSYVDPTSGTQKFCDARCPLPEGNLTAQDFYFVNTVGMNSFRIDISGFYGKGGGLSGIELFQNDNFAFAVSDFNEPVCDGVSSAGAKSTQTGPWVITPSGTSNSQYLTAVLEGTPVNQSAAQVVFQPDIRQSGNYSVVVYTPGCMGDGTCGTRGRVNVTGNFRRTPSSSDPSSTMQLFQTNNFDKYDEIYLGFIESTDSFKPTVTITPMPNQNGPLTIVAQRIKFDLRSASSGNLNGVFEYDPNKQVVDTNFQDSVIDSAGASLSPRDQAIINSVVSNNDSLFVAGNFSGNGLNNIFTVGKDAKNASALPGNGLNSEVRTMYLNGSTIYIGGNFTNTQDGKSQGLNGVAAFSTSDNKWQPLGAGVNGIVMHIVPFALNLTANHPETVLGISGFFTQVNAAGGNASFSVDNFAIWAPSRSNWLHNLNIGTISIEGSLMAFTEVPGSDPLFSGSVNSQALGASGAVALEDGNPLSLEPFPVKNIQPHASSTASLRKRATSNGQNQTGVVTATFYKQNGMNKTILAGNFVATATDGSNITSLLIIDGKDSDKVTGLGDEISSDSVFMSLNVLDSVLFAGGAISGTINNDKIAGILSYDLSANKYVGTQPPALRGPNVTVNAIAPRPKSKDIFVGGVFNSAGDLSCQGLCIWNTERNQWVLPSTISGWVSALVWISDTKLLVAGNITVGNNQTTIATFDQSKNTFESFAGANSLPGPVTAMAVATGDGSEIWASGQASDGSSFLRRFDGKTWHAVTESMFGPGTNIRGLQVLTISKDHGKSSLIAADQDLLILGQINVTNFGTASGVLFNGTTLEPFLLSSTSNGSPGSLSTAFFENPQNLFNNQKKHLKVIFVVLIALAIALGLTFLLIVAGILIESYRKRSKGYTPMQMSYPDRSVNVNRVPPSELFGTLGRGRNTAPAI